MSAHKFKIILLSVGLLLFVTASLYPKGDKNKKKQNAKVTAQRAGSVLDINNIYTSFYNDGDSDFDKGTQNAGFVYPKGSGKTAVFEAGLLWGAKVPGDSIPRVGGSSYNHGLQPGPIMADGQPASDPTADQYRVYRVRPDVYPGGPDVDLNQEATLEGKSAAQLRTEYEEDWTQWPANLGAPYDDKNKDGKYEAGTDVPGVPGADQTIWFVSNDQNKDLTQALYGADPLGIEMQATIWAYNQQGALGNMYFRKYKFINKGYQKYNIDSMYVSMWADVDLGDAGDDFVGVDTTLSLQYCYNANATDAIYGATPPAIGFDFFQGPLVKGLANQDINKNGVDDAQDFGIFDGKQVGPGLINLPMTAAYYFANGDANIGDPTLGDIEGSIEFYRFFKGEYGISGDPFKYNGVITKYALSGDPVTRTGWLDGNQLPAGDRRQGSSSGPFNMAPGDTQEVVVAEIVAGNIPGVDRISAISLLKFYDKQAQLAYNNFFDLPSAPPAPEVKAIELSHEIVLDWGGKLDKVRATENSTSKGFAFQGYNIYQLPYASASLSEAKRLDTYDIVDGVGKIIDQVFDPSTGSVIAKPVQFGNDNGVNRSVIIKTDAFKDNNALINGIKYYFAVTAYSYNPDPNAVPNNLENPLKVITVIPHEPDPGKSYGEMPGDTLLVTHSSGASDGIVVPVVVDPTATTGHEYTVRFKNSASTSQDAVADSWELYDNASKSVVYSSNNLTGNDGGTISDSSNYYQTNGGVHLQVAGPPVAVKDYTSTGTRWVSGTNAGLSSFFGGLGMGAEFFGSDLPASKYVPVEIKFVGGANSPSEANGWSQGAVYWRSDGYNYHGKGWMPFTVWDISDPANPKQINASFVEDANDGSANLQWDMGWNGTAFAANGGREYLFINDTPYDPNHYNGTVDGTFNDVLYAMWPSARGSHPYLEAPFQLDIFPNYPVLVKDAYTFKTTAPDSSASLAKADVEKINVFPNPYYGVNSQEINKYNRFVTFSHLPANATIRIFNLAGVLVRTVDHNSNSQFEKWDLNNESGLPVASGMYIAYIDMPDLGKTKILKFAIIQEQQILDRF